MKLYVVSGLGADFKVLEKLKFPENFEVLFLDWLIPERNESFQDYIVRMADRVDDSEPFCLLGYSFGGIVVQEINKLKPARKTVILASIKSHHEKSRFIKLGERTGLPKYFPERIFTTKSALAYSFVRKFFDPQNPRLMQYFNVREAYYLKWCIEKISGWKCEECPGIIQIMGDRDIVFPIKYSKPDYVIKNGTHLFPATKPRETSEILAKVFAEQV